jgi:hypothetical protein
LPHKNYQERLEYFRLYRAKNRKAMTDYYRAYRARPEYQKRKKSIQVKFYVKLRLEVFQHYSGKEVPECECCGEKVFEFLTLDHINNDGNKYRKKNGKSFGGNRFYSWLRVNDYPPEIKLRVLCYNCNCARAYFGGECPHKQIGLYSALLAKIKNEPRPSSGK